MDSRTTPTSSSGNEATPQNKKSPRLDGRRAAYRAALYGIMLSVALVLSYLESLIPIPLPLPGVKLGLCNIVVVIIFTKVSKTGAVIISLLRVIIMSLLFGTVSSLWFALLGAAAAYLVLAALWPLFKRNRVGYIGVCAACAAAHNLGQITAACIMTESAAMFRYLPPLLIIGSVFGVITGISSVLITKIKFYTDKN